jgi:diguanylate cyclase (GGDEF)-like protein
MPIRNEQGNIVGTFGISTDITERIQAEEELRRATDELATLNVKLQKSLEHQNLLACTDGLTGLCNHRYLFELAAREFHAAVRYQRALAFLMFDIDYFKQVNDTRGHAEGNKLLMAIAQTAVAHVRASDLVARYGGDEFVVILPDTSAKQVLPVAERIRASVAAIQIWSDQQEPPTVTLSMGIADLRREPMDENVEQIFQRADEALYQAKHSGRNRVVIFGAG